MSNSVSMMMSRVATCPRLVRQVHATNTHPRCTVSGRALRPIFLHFPGLSTHQPSCAISFSLPKLQALGKDTALGSTKRPSCWQFSNLFFETCTGSMGQPRKHPEYSGEEGGSISHSEACHLPVNGQLPCRSRSQSRSQVTASPLQYARDSTAV